jgi:bromodomain-containing factor 1
MRKINIILKSLLEHNEAYDFKQPVDWKGDKIDNVGMNLTDYPTIVKHPMDLGSVEKNLKNDKYKYVE